MRQILKILIQWGCKASGHVGDGRGDGLRKGPEGGSGLGWQWVVCVVGGMRARWGREIPHVLWAAVDSALLLSVFCCIENSL